MFCNDWVNKAINSGFGPALAGVFRGQTSNIYSPVQERRGGGFTQ
jgi:hypothetical protein